MDYQVEIIKPWSYRDRARGMQKIAPGCYRVPEELGSDIAARAVGEGMARKLVKTADLDPVGPPVNFRGKTRRKPRPPKNKSLGPAPENKSLLE